MLAKANSILVGGFSFGALMAHEAAHQLEELSIPVDQVLLLDPACIVGPQFNMPGRFVRFSIVRWLRKMPSQSWLMKRVEVIYRKGLRQTAIMTFKPSSVRSKTWVQTTRKRRRSIEELMGKTFSRVHWQNEETTSHLDIVLEPELQARWLEIIRLWGK
jgi:thioesterase domain-containing protein